MSTPAPTPVRITTFPTNTKHLTTTGIFALIILASSSHSFVEPGSPLWDYGLKHLVASPATLYPIQNWTFRLLVGIHTLEVPLFAWLKLRKHGVSLFSGVAAKWLLSVFFSGKATWDLFAAAVKDAELKRL